MHAPYSRPLRILHVVRAPVGGLFRHVCDLAAGQAARGHAVGIIADSKTGGPAAEAAFAELGPRLALGVNRVAIAREIGPADMTGLMRMRRIVYAAAPDILHGHGAKGGAFARLLPGPDGTIRAYTPHGGSLHYHPKTLQGLVYGTLERLLMRRTDLFLFESDFARQRYVERIAVPSGVVRVVHNGVGPNDFIPVVPAPDATDFLFVGELRRLKGVDLLFDALALLRRNGRPAAVTVVGAGPDDQAFRTQAARLGLTGAVRFAGYRPAREAFRLGRVLVLPSRNESLPYVVLEAGAAGLPIIATRVGGLPEIFGPQESRLVPREDVGALAAACIVALDKPQEQQAAAAALRERVREAFSVDAMVAGVIEAYREALSARVVSAH